MPEEQQENIKKQDQKTCFCHGKLFVFTLGLFVAIVLGAGAVYGIGLKGIKQSSRSPFTMKTAQIFALPIARVNGAKILYTDYVDNMQAMELFYETDTEGLERPSAEDMSDFVLSRLIINKIIESAAQDLKVSLSQEEINAVVDTQILVNFESREKANEEILTRYGWTFDEFIKKIVEPTELENKLSVEYASSQQPDKGIVQAQAQATLDRINAGESFEALYAEYSQNSQNNQNGATLVEDLGWFGKGKMVAEFENAAFALEIDHMTSELVETRYGFHIIYVDDKRTTTNEETGETAEEVSARHILFPTVTTDANAFRDFMNERLKNTRVDVIEGTHNPFEDYFKSLEAPATTKEPIEENSSLEESAPADAGIEATTEVTE